MTSKTPFEFRKRGSTWQRRLIAPGSSWETLDLESEVRTVNRGGRPVEVMAKRWVWR